MKCKECNIRKGCLVHDPSKCVIGKLFPPKEHTGTVQFKNGKVKTNPAE